MESNEEELLHSAALQNAASILLARQRAEQELLRTKVELEIKMVELARSLATTEASLRERDRARLVADEARLAAQAANEAKSRFLNMMSHELRTPLGAIGGYAALLEEEIPGALTEEQRKYIGRIRYNQAHLLQLVNELLDLGKIESGTFTLNPGVFAIRPVVDSVYSMIEPQIRASNMRLEVDAGDPSLLFYADRDRVQQILLNLLSNSVKFTPPGGRVRITVGVEPDTINVCVEDTGVGIPANQLEAVFEAFFQVNASRSRDHGGSGLGLAISRRLAREMKGDLKVKSVLGEGSTFTLSLPRSLS